MGKLRAEGAYRDAVDELLPQVEAAFTGPAFWVAFLKRAHAAEIPRVSEWLNTTGRIVEERFGRRGLRWKRPADTPLSTSPLDAFINPIRTSIGPRAYGLKNRARTKSHADAHAPTRQRSRRRTCLHERDPRVARGQPRPPADRPASRHRPQWGSLSSLTQRISESNLTGECSRLMREGARASDRLPAARAARSDLAGQPAAPTRRGSSVASRTGTPCLLWPDPPAERMPPSCPSQCSGCSSAGWAASRGHRVQQPPTAR